MILVNMVDEFVMLPGML